MLANLFTVAVRHAAKHRMYAIINVAGLAVGLACAILIGLLVRDELSFDRQFPDTDNLYRVSVKFQLPGRAPLDTAVTMYPLGPAMVADIPELQAMARFAPRSAVVKYQDKQFYEEVAPADPTILKVLPLSLVLGDPATALQRPESIVLNEALAKKYFGDANPLGKVLTLHGQHAVEVTGVMKDLPHNTHLQLSALIPLASKANPSRHEEETPLWGNINWYTYVRLLPGASPHAVAGKIVDIFKKNVKPEEWALNVTMDELIKIELDAFKDIHLHTHRVFGMRPDGDWLAVVGFSAIAALLLLIACINFMNLATARASLRAREVGVRKVMGASRAQLVAQFLTESVMLSLVALVLGLALAEMLAPPYAAFLERPLRVNILADAELLLASVALAVAAGLLGGAYPAFVLAAFRPALVLKTNPSGQGGSGRLRTGLVIVQFAISIGLGIATAVVFAQVDYATHRNLGFNRSNVVMVHVGDGFDFTNLRETMRLQMGGHPDVLGVTIHGVRFFNPSESNNVVRLPNSEKTALLRQATVEPGFFEFHGIPLLAGRHLSQSRGEDLHDVPWRKETVALAEGRSVLINRAALSQLGFTSPQDAVGKVIQEDAGDGSGKGPAWASRIIVGVVADANIVSPRSPVLPSLYDYNPSRAHEVSIRINGEHRAEAMAHIENVWRQLVPNVPIRWSFLDEEHAKLLADDKKRGDLFGAFALIAIFIACLGLFGLASFTAERRTKEIGVRRVFGASRMDVVRLLVWQFSKPVLVANALAWPVVAYYLRNWLNGFEYRMELSPLYFVAAGTVALLIAWGTVASQALRAARSKPAHALRYE